MRFAQQLAALYHILYEKNRHDSPVTVDSVDLSIDTVDKRSVQIRCVHLTRGLPRKVTADAGSYKYPTLIILKWSRGIKPASSRSVRAYVVMARMYFCPLWNIAPAVHKDVTCVTRWKILLRAISVVFFFTWSRRGETKNMVGFQRNLFLNFLSIFWQEKLAYEFVESYLIQIMRGT